MTLNIIYRGGGGGGVREGEIVDTCGKHKEYFMARAHELLTYQNHRMSEISGPKTVSA